MVITIDFETRSEVDLIACGRIPYAYHESTDILMMSYKEDDGPVKLWLPGEPLPWFCAQPSSDELEDLEWAFRLKAFNAQFEYIIWNKIGCDKYGFIPTPLSMFDDIQALCGRYGLPQNLADAAVVMKLKNQKMGEGKQLIKLFCTPSDPLYPFGRDSSGDIAQKYLPQWEKFKEYCLADTEAEYELMKALPSDKLSEKEQKTWIMSCEINMSGIPVAKDEAERIYKISESYKAGQFELLPDLTNGKVTKITQVKRIKDWANEYFRSIGEFELENLQSETVEELLVRDDLPDNLMMVLEMRARMGLSSTGKYKQIINREFNGYVHDNLRYYGAHTGRWTGGGFQLLNLPRASVDDPEAEIHKFMDPTMPIFEDNPVKSARALIRSMIKAKPGYVIGAADYSSIEYVVLEWFAGEYNALDRFRAGYDQYTDEAVGLYGIPYEEITKPQRQDGKIIILGCGYGMGAYGLQRSAAKWGMDLQWDKAAYMVKRYRNNHPKVVKMWYDFKDAMIYVIQNPGSFLDLYHCSVTLVKDRNKKRWLALTLPSGRTMYYMEPFVEHSEHGLIPEHWGQYRTNNTWVKMHLIPGRIVENVVQAAARDILVDGKLELRSRGFNIVGSIYDEVIVHQPEHTFSSNEEMLKSLEEGMCVAEPWASEIPLSAEGFIGPRYKKM